MSRDGPRKRCETRDSRLHVDGMEGSRNAERNESGAPRRVSRQRSQLLSRTSSDNLAAAIVVGCRQAVGLESGQHVVRITADEGRHRCRGHRAGFGHSTATLAYEDHRLFRRQDADPGCSGDLAYRVPGNDADEWIAIGRMRDEFERGQQPSGNQERLGDRGVSDGFGVGCCAVVPEIEARYSREPIEPVSEGGYVEPGPEKPWCLGTLTGRHNRKHICTISWPGRKRRTGTPRIFGRPIVGF